jgi:CheY-like chemotaxis protein
MASDPIKILIVDDDEEVLIALERLLESEGYNTATAWSRIDAIALLEKSQFDLLLVDEFLEGRDAEPLIVELHLKQPQAFQLLLHTGKSQKRRTTPHRVCKWEHGEMKAAIRQYLAA